MLLIDVTGEKEGTENKTGSTSSTSEHMAQSRKLCLGDKAKGTLEAVSSLEKVNK